MGEEGVMMVMLLREGNETTGRDGWKMAYIPNRGCPWPDRSFCFPFRHRGIVSDARFSRALMHVRVNVPRNMKTEQKVAGVER